MCHCFFNFRQFVNVSNMNSCGIILTIQYTVIILMIKQGADNPNVN